MRKDPGFAYKLTLLFGDAFAIIFSFAFAYYFRINIDHRAYYFDSQIGDFVIANFFLLPVWIIILSSLGLYSKRVLSSRPLKVWRLFLASVVGVMSIITYDFFASAVFNRGSLFPVRIIALYAIFFCFIMLIMVRLIISLIYQLSFIFFIHLNVSRYKSCFMSTKSEDMIHLAIFVFAGFNILKS